VAARYGAYNVVFIVAGEWNEWGATSLYDSLGQTIAANDPHGRMIGIHSTGSVEQWADNSWMSFGDYQQIYNSLYANILSRRDHNKPVVNSEYAYFLRDSNGDGKVDKPNSATREEFRRATWEILMAGGYTVTGFGTTYYGGIRDPGPFDVDTAKNDPAEADLTRALAFFTTSRWWELQPDDTVLSGSGTLYALVNPESQYLVYATGATSTVTLTLNAAGSGTYEVRRFDPRTGAWTSLPDYTGSTSITLAVPDNQDWAWSVSRTGVFDSSPTVSLATSAVNIPVGGSATFTPVATDPDGTIASHTWHFGATTVPGTGPPGPTTRTFPTEGIVPVWVEVLDNDGNTGASPVISVSVSANQPPTITSATASPNTIQEGGSVTFAATATDPEGDPLTFSWDIDSDGTPEYSGAGATHTFSTAGNYSITVSVSDGINTVSGTVTVDVDPIDTVPPAPPENVQVQ
jgi:hypothetical protein